MAMFSFCGFFGSSKVAVIDQNSNALDFLNRISATTYKKDRDNARLKALIKHPMYYINDSFLGEDLWSQNIAGLRKFFLGSDGEKPIYRSQKGETKALLIETLNVCVHSALAASEELGDDLVKQLLDLTYDLNRSVKRDISKSEYAAEIIKSSKIVEHLLLSQWVSTLGSKEIKEALPQDVSNLDSSGAGKDSKSSMRSEKQAQYKPLMFLPRLATLPGVAVDVNYACDARFGNKLMTRDELRACMGGGIKPYRY